MGEHTRYRVNAPKVIHETIDGEVILVHVETGYYYELTNAGVEVWRCLDLGMDLAQIVEQLAVLYRGDQKEVEDSTRELIEELLSEQLVVARPVGPGDGPAVPAAPVSPSEAAARPPYVRPVLQKHADLQGLLLLDPVHEVGEQGWPAPKEDKKPA